jgi:Na+-transporting NADH:ubiquinone oxidoreductase subunit E
MTFIITGLMAIGFMSFGGMLTGGDEPVTEKPKVEANIEKKEVKKAAKEIVAENTNIKLVEE